MNLVSMIVQEIRHRRWGFIIGALSMTVAIGCLVGSHTLLAVHDAVSDAMLGQKEAELEASMAKLKDDMRVATLKLGLNLAILPKNQSLNDWYADDYGEVTMPESRVEELADSGVVTVRHFLPILQQKVKWPEQKRTIILTGTRGEVPNLHKSYREPMIDAVPPGTIVLGHELHNSLGFEVGDTVSLMGREFTVHRCHEERGSKDDITAWIHLSEAQQLFGKEGEINAILALNCLCKGRNLALMREEVAGALPDVQVVELGTEKAIARAEARFGAAKAARKTLEQEKAARSELRASRQRLASILVAVVLAASALWIGFLSLTNVRDRRGEIGILRAIGFRVPEIMTLFLAKAVLMGLLGSLAGIGLGWVIGRNIALSLEGGLLDGLEQAGSVSPMVLGWALILAPLLAAIAAWLPSIWAVQQDPADILGKD